MSAGGERLGFHAKSSRFGRTLKRTAPNPADLEDSDDDSDEGRLASDEDSDREAPPRNFDSALRATRLFGWLRRLRLSMES